MRRARAGHRVDHRTISSGCSRPGTVVPVDDTRIMIAPRSPMRTSISAAPACFAARIARAISAWVMLAGRRATVTKSALSPGTRPVIWRANDLSVGNTRKTGNISLRLLPTTICGGFWCFWYLRRAKRVWLPAQGWAAHPADVVRVFRPQPSSADQGIDHRLGPRFVDGAAKRIHADALQ